MITKQIDKESDNPDELTKLFNEGKDIFLLIYMEGCGPCNATRPIWCNLIGKDDSCSKMDMKHNNNLNEKIKKNTNVAIVQYNKDLLNKLPKELEEKIGSIDGFPTMKYINKNKETKDYNGERSVSKLSEWVNEILNESSGGGRRRRKYCRGGITRKKGHTKNYKKSRKTYKKHRKNRKKTRKSNGGCWSSKKR
jgi:hypothetical protein